MMHILFSNVRDPSQLRHCSVCFQPEQAAQVGQAITAGVSRFRSRFLVEPLPKAVQSFTQLFYFIQGQAPAV